MKIELIQPNCLQASDEGPLLFLDGPGVDIDFVAPGTEQYAFAAYLARFHGTPEQAIQLPPQPQGEQAWTIELSGLHE